MAELRAKMMVKEEALGLGTKKLHRKMSGEEFTERWFKGLCMFCNELETPDHYLCHKNSELLMVDCDEGQTRNGDELVETEVATELNGIEDRAVENEANAKVISAIVKEESNPQFQMVTEADSTCEHTNVILQQVSISPFEHSLNFCKANLDVRGNCQYAMGKTHHIWSDSNFGCVDDGACQVFDEIPLRKRIVPKKHKKRFHKCWRFKFKYTAQPRGLIQEELCVQEANETMNQLKLPMHLERHILHQQLDINLCEYKSQILQLSNHDLETQMLPCLQRFSGVRMGRHVMFCLQELKLSWWVGYNEAVGVTSTNQELSYWSVTKDGCVILETNFDGFGRGKTKMLATSQRMQQMDLFSLGIHTEMEENVELKQLLVAMERFSQEVIEQKTEGGLICGDDSSKEEAESFPFLNFAAGQHLLWMQNNSEPILIVSELERNKKLCYKTWMFKYKVDEEDQGILQSRTHNENDWIHSLVDTNYCEIWPDKTHVELQEMSCFLSEESVVWFVGYKAHGRELLVGGVKQLTLAAKKFYLKHKWRSRLLQSFSELKQRIIMSLWKSLGYLMEDVMEEDLKQQGNSEPLEIIPDVDAKVELVWESNSLVFHFKTRVWDPGRSLIEDATPREFPYHSTATISFSLLFFLSRITCKFSSLQTLRTRFP